MMVVKVVTRYIARRPRATTRTETEDHKGYIIVRRPRATTRTETEDHKGYIIARRSQGNYQN